MGFVAGAAIVIGLQQLKGLLGISHFTNKTDIISVVEVVHHHWSPLNFILGCSFLSFILITIYVVVLGGGQDASAVTTTDHHASKFEAKFYDKILQEEIGGVKGHFGPINAFAFNPYGKRLSLQEMELFLVQAWILWNQRNKLLHGGKIQNPNMLCRRAVEYLEEYQTSQGNLRVDGVVQSVGDVWKPPPNLVFKLNFDAVVFVEAKRTGFGAIIRNDKGEVTAPMSAGGPPVSSSEEAELLASRKAIEFAIDAGFSELVIEGDNSNVMKALSYSLVDQSLLGNVVDDVRHLVCGKHWVNFSCIRRGGNRVAYALAQHARNIFENVF